MWPFRQANPQRAAVCNQNCAVKSEKEILGQTHFFVRNFKKEISGAWIPPAHCSFILAPIYYHYFRAKIRRSKETDADMTVETNELKLFQVYFHTMPVN